MWVLGLSGYGHDSAAALVHDGRLVAAAEEERFSGIKHDGSLPVRAARWVCAEAGIRRVDRIVFYHRPRQDVVKRLSHVVRHLPASRGFLRYRGHDIRGWGEMLRLRGPTLARTLDLESDAPLVFADHHRCHAMDAVGFHGAGEGAVLTIDGMGEWSTARFSQLRGGNLRDLSDIPFPHSLGIFWETVTEHLGFRPHGDEYKVMGLAAHGEPDQLGAMTDAIRTVPNGEFRLDLSFFRHQFGFRPSASTEFVRRFGPARRPDEPITDRHRALAASAQCRLQEIVLHMTEHLRRATSSRDLYLGGGVALNCAMNGWLGRNGPFDRVHVPPAPNDAGAAVGAARSAAPLSESTSDAAVLVGPSVTAGEVEDCLSARGDLRLVESGDPVWDAAERIAEGQIVGWCHGPMEFGPRALGNRSILADPRRVDLRDHVNAVVKNRESFRPLAASMLEEYASEVMELPWPTRYMLFAFPVRPGWRDRIAGVVHADGTCRVQTVPRDDDRPYRRLLEAFHQITGTPAVLNTSLNTVGQTMARTIEDAIHVFDQGPLDALYTPAGLVVRASVAVPRRLAHAP